jgi:hypothetical protein
VEVRQTVWGFDGQYVPERFNLLSVFVDNPSPTAFDGELVLSRTDAVGRRVGEDFVEPCFLSPNAGRWVQFCVYMSSDADTWRLSWGSGRGVTLPNPRRGALARVLLADNDLVTESGGGLRRFPDQIFPVSVTATQALDSVTLSHVPKWESARRQAFMDWLASGGTAHVLLDARGAPPVFTHELTPLNNPAPVFRVGAGLVVRHAIPRRECDVAFLASRGYPAPPEYKALETEYRKTEDFIFSRLNQLTRARHNWPLIYLVVLVYVVVVAPVNYLLARRRSWETALGFFLGTVAFFTLLIGFIGRRDLGEASAVNTVSYARPLGGAEWDVTQWTNVFVVASKTHSIAHRSANDLYSTCQDAEAVRGYAHNGSEGRLVVEMPLFSNRAFQHRAVMKASIPAVELNSLRVETTPQGEEIVASVSFTGARPEGFKSAWAAHRGRVYGLTWDGNALRCVNQNGQRLEEFAESGVQGFNAWSEPGEVKSDEAFLSVMPRLVRRAIGGVESARTAFTRPDPKAAVHLFIYARAPESFNLPAGALGRETGCVLYHLIFFKSGEHSWGTLNVRPRNEG